jgi:hypothetical protein
LPLVLEDIVSRGPQLQIVPERAMKLFGVVELGMVVFEYAVVESNASKPFVVAKASV